MTLFDRETKLFLRTYKRLPVEIARGQGCYLVTKDGRRILDFFAGLAVNALGYDDRDVLRAIIYQQKNYLHLSNLFVQDAQLEFAELLLRTTGYDRIFLTNSGTESIEAAIKLIRRWGKDRKKTDLLSFEGAFHGRTMGSLSLTGRKKYREGFDPFLPSVDNIPLNDVELLREKVSSQTAAFFLEPVQGEGGVRPVAQNFIDELLSLKQEYGFLIVADEIQTGIGRTGKFLASEHFGFKPDILLLAKAIGGGLPLGALLTGEGMLPYFPPGSHGTTFGGNPVACAAGTVVVKKVSEQAFLSEVTRKGEALLVELLSVQNDYPDIIKEVRGLGLMVGIELTRPGDTFVEKFLENDILINCTDETVLRLLPPLVIVDSEIDRFLEVFRSILNSTR